MHSATRAGLTIIEAVEFAAECLLLGKSRRSVVWFLAEHGFHHARAEQLLRWATQRIRHAHSLPNELHVEAWALITHTSQAPPAAPRALDAARPGAGGVCSAPKLVRGLVDGRHYLSQAVRIAYGRHVLCDDGQWLRLGEPCSGYARWVRRAGHALEREQPLQPR